jgi:hypothetical protein
MRSASDSAAHELLLECLNASCNAEALSGFNHVSQEVEYEQAERYIGRGFVCASGEPAAV